MKLEQVKIDKIKRSFSRMQSTNDLLNLLNEVKPLIYGEQAVPFKLSQLTFYSNPRLGGKRYAEFRIKKKSGAVRTIHAPVKGLKAIQKTLGLILQCVFQPHDASMGFVMGRSIVDNAKMHAGRLYVFNIDLKDFFPSIDQARVWKCLQLKPFNLVAIKAVEMKLHPKSKRTAVVIFDNGFRALASVEKAFRDDGDGRFNALFLNEDGTLADGWDIGLIENVHWVVNLENAAKVPYEVASESPLSKASGTGYRRESDRKRLAAMIAAICCTEMEVERKDQEGVWVKVRRNVLPQGAPTSPVITNVVCQKLDFLLTGVAKRFGLRYSRYADDITFSSMHNVYQKEGEFMLELNRIIRSQGFHIKESKTRLQKDGYRKEVTGLLVNDKVNVQKRYVKQLRMWLYYWERYGYERASDLFRQQYFSDKGHVKKGKPNMSNVIAGKLNYLKMVKGENSIRALRNRFLLLENNRNHLSNRRHHLIYTIDLILEGRLSEALRIFNPLENDH